MNWHEEDLSFLLSATDEIGEYLTSPVIDWNLHSSRLVLTPGRVLFALQRLSTISDTDPKIPNLVTSINNQIMAKSMLWQKKVNLELPRRFNIWKNAMSDFLEEGLDKSYTAQVVHRVIIDLLKNATISIPQDLEAHIRKLDDDLRVIAKPGNFIWDEPLRKAFPDLEYWYLYVGPKKG